MNSIDNLSIDIILPNYNKGEYIDECILSILNQSFLNWKLYIIDDCSTDNSLKKINKYKDYKKIQILKLKKNKGPSFCRNLGMRLSKNSYISFIDSDDYWTKDKLKNQLEFMKMSNYGFTFTDYVPFFQIKNEKKFLRKTNIISTFDFKKFCRNSSINTSTMIVKRSLIILNKFKKMKKLEDYVFKCEILKRSNAIKFDDCSAFYRILKYGRSSSKLENLMNLWSVNKKYNNLNLLDNFLSVLFISINSLKKYGFK